MLEPLLRKLQVLKPTNLLKGEYCKIFKNTILVKICEQLLLQFLLLTVNISFWVLVSALNSIDLQRSSSRFKKFCLGCLVVGSSFIWKKKEKLAGMVTRITRCHYLSLVVTLCHPLSLVVTRCHSLWLVVPLVVTRCHSLSLVPLVVTRCHSMYHSSVFL